MKVKARLFTMTVLCLVLFPILGVATPCMNDPLSEYMSRGFSCSVGAFSFSNFAYTIGTSGGDASDAVPANDVLVIPVNNSNGAGFIFKALLPNGWSAGSGLPNDVNDSFITFQGAISGPSSITDFSEVTGALFGGTGKANVLEGVCSGISASCLKVNNFLDVSNNGTDILHTQEVFSSTGVFSAGKDIELGDGPGGGSAQISTISDQFSRVPEPSPLFLLGAGLPGLLLVVKKRRQVAGK